MVKASNVCKENKSTSNHDLLLLTYILLHWQANRAELTPDQWQRLQTSGFESVVDRAAARTDAQQLHQAGEKKLGTDESAFLSILAIRNHLQMRAIFEEYAKVVTFVDLRYYCTFVLYPHVPVCIWYFWTVLNLI